MSNFQDDEDSNNKNIHDILYRNPRNNSARVNAGKKSAAMRGHQNLSEAGRKGAYARTHQSRVEGGKKAAETRGHACLSAAGRKGAERTHGLNNVKKKEK